VRGAKSWLLAGGPGDTKMCAVQGRERGGEQCLERGLAKKPLSPVPAGSARLPPGTHCPGAHLQTPVGLFT